MGPTGTGLGTRSLPDRANALRILTIETRPEVGTPVRPWDVGSVTVIGFDIDDQSPEDLAVALEQLRTTDGVVDVVQHPVAAKKGRLGVHVRILCRPDARDQVISVCFDQTTTIGLRWRDESRAELERLAVSHGDIDGKAVVRPDGSVTSKPEVDSIAAVAVTRSQRDLTRIRFQAETELES